MLYRRAGACSPPRRCSRCRPPPPCAETKEQLAGFYLVEARDLNEAIQLAGHIPAARVGCVEVRPVRELDIHAHA